MDWKELRYRLSRRIYRRVHVRVGDGVHVGHYVFGVLVRVGRRVRSMS